MLQRIILLSVHVTLDLLCYRIPRIVHTGLVKLPVSLWELISRTPQLTYAPSTERHIDVITSTKDAAAAAAVRDLFGIRLDMHYEGPLYSGHLHTILGGARLSRRVEYERELLEAADTNPICLDWLKVPSSSGTAAKGVILLIPGLGNYGQSNYIQRFARCAVQHGFHVCLLTPRGMGSAPLTTPNITSVTFTSDMQHVLRHRLTRDAIARDFGAPLPLYAVGYSCGGSTLLKCVAEETQAHAASGGSLYPGGFPVEAVVSLTAPNDMEASADMLRANMSRLLYVKPIQMALLKYLRKHSKALLMASEGKSEEERSKLPLIHTDFTAAMRLIKQPSDIDTHVVAAHFGYKDRFAYYKDGDALQYVEKIVGVPVLCLNTRDDPIVGYAVPQAAWQQVCNTNSNVVYVEVPSGGHLGFVQSPWQEWASPFSFLQKFPVQVLDSVAASTTHRNKKQQ